jgi:hypothetical protein
LRDHRAGVLRRRAQRSTATEFAENAAGGGVSRWIIKGRVTITASKTFEVQHYTAATRAANGLGVATNDGAEAEI